MLPSLHAASIVRYLSAEHLEDAAHVLLVLTSINHVSRAVSVNGDRLGEKGSEREKGVSVPRGGGSESDRRGVMWVQQALCGGSPAAARNSGSVRPMQWGCRRSGWFLAVLLCCFLWYITSIRKASKVARNKKHSLCKIIRVALLAVQCQCIMAKVMVDTAYGVFAESLACSLYRMSDKISSKRRSGSHPELCLSSGISELSKMYESQQMGVFP